MDISGVAVQEMGLSTSGTLREKDYMFFWQGKAPEEKTEVSFAMRNNLLSCTMPPSERTERLLKPQLQISARSASLIGAMLWAVFC